MSGSETLADWLRRIWDDEQRAEESKTTWTPRPEGVRCPHCRMPVEEFTTGGPLRFMTLGPCGDDVTRAEWETMVIVKPAGDRRKLADIAAKRALFNAADGVVTSHAIAGTTQLHDAVARLLAQSYRGEPGWREEWDLEV